MHHATEKAPDMSGNSVEGENRNPNTHEGEPIMNSLPTTTDPALTSTHAKGIDNLLEQMREHGVTTLGELHAAQTAERTCPRCHGLIEMSPDGTLFAAGSRATADRDIRICADCGGDEALRQYYDNGRVVPPSEWPIADPHHYRQRMEPMRVDFPNTEGPAWADYTAIDNDGTTLGYSRVLHDLGNLTVELHEEVEPTRQLLHVQRGGLNWEFEYSDEVVATATAMLEAAKQWQRIQAGEQS